MGLLKVRNVTDSVRPLRQWRRGNVDSASPSQRKPGKRLRRFERLEQRWLLAAAIQLDLTTTAVNEADGVAAITGTVTRVDPPNLTTALTVVITTGAVDKLSFPATVTIPADQSSATFAIDTINNAVVDGNVDVNLSAAAVGFAPASMTVTVADDDTASVKTIGGELVGQIAAGSYSVSHSIVVPTGKVLTLMPGAEIAFSANQGVKVFGALLAQGTESQRVTLSSAADSPLPGDWNGVEILANSSQLPSKLEQVLVQHASTGVRVSSSFSPLSIESSEIRDNLASGMLVVDDNRPANIFVQHSLITKNGGNGVLLSGSASGCNAAVVGITLLNNTISENGASGVAMGVSASSGCLIGPGGATADPVISGNKIHNNLNGITGVASNSSSRAGHLLPLIFNNFIHDNVQDGIRLTTSGSQATFEPEIIHNTIVRNGGNGIFHDPVPDAGMRIFSNAIVANVRGINTDAGHQTVAGTVGFNDAFGNLAGDWNQYPTSFGDLTTTNARGIPADIFHNVHVDPLFAVDGLHIQLNSPLVGSASIGSNQLSVPTTDIDGNTRLAVPDIGADEVDKLLVTLEPNGALDDSTTVISGVLQVREGSTGTVTATVTRNVPDLSGELTVAIPNPDPAAFGLPSTVVIPSGSPSTTFAVTVLEDGGIEPESDYVLLATAAGFHASSTTAIRIIDNEVLPAALEPSVETRINVLSTDFSATEPDVVWLASDRYVTVWRAADSSGNTKIFARIFDAQDQPVSDEIPIVTLPTGWIEQRSQVAADTAGNFVVGWTEITNSGTLRTIVSRRYDMTGKPLTDRVILPDPAGGQPLLHDLAAAPDGGWAISYRDNSAQLLVQRFAADGALLQTPTLMAPATLLPGLCALAYDDDGNLLVVWHQDNSLNGLRGLRFRRFVAATAAWSEVIPLTSISFLSSHLEPHVSPAADGSFAVTWLHRASSAGAAFPWVQRWSGDGEAITDAFAVSSVPAVSASRLGSIASSPSGDFALTWNANNDIFVRQYHAGGLPKAAAQLISTATGPQSHPRISLAPDGAQYVVVWEGNGPDDAQGVFSRRLVIEQPQLELSVDAQSLPEAGGTNTATLSRSGVGMSGDLVVSVSSSDTTEATVPATVIIPAGQTSATFNVTAVNDDLADGIQDVGIDIVAFGFPDVSATLQVVDDDSRLTLTLSQSTVSEAGGPAAATGTISRNSDTSQPLVVTLTSSNVDEASVPVQVTIPAGEASVTFPVDAVDEIFVDGSQSITLTAAADGHDPSDVALTVDDDDVPTLLLLLSQTEIIESAGSDAATGTVTRNTDVSDPLLVTVHSTAINAAIVPSQILIPAGQASASFAIASVDDIFVDGDQVATLSAKSFGFVSASADVTATDDDSPLLRLLSDQTTFAENAGSAAAVVTVFRNSAFDGPLVIDLTSDRPTDIAIPAQVTIPAGERTATFTLDVVDNGLADGDRSLTITAAAAEHTVGAVSITITEDDSSLLTITLDPPTVAENDGVGATTGTVFRNSLTDKPLVVNLHSDPSGDAIVPAEVTIPAGQRSATFIVETVDNAIFAGDRVLTIDATAAEHDSGSAELTVQEDDDPPMVTLRTDKTIIGESAGIATFTATLSAAAAVPVTVNLGFDSDDATGSADDYSIGDLQIVILAGATTGSIALSAVQDIQPEIDEVLIVEVLGVTHGTASEPRQAMLTIVDDDLPRDFGDAPAPYPVPGSENGARHTIGSLFLGSSVDEEGDGQPKANADGDGSDEDGVIVLTTLIGTQAVSTTSSALVIASGSGKLDGWIDFNSDGDWSDAGEQIFNSVALEAGENLLSFIVPAGATAADTGARFRLSTAGSLSPTGAAEDGEVEDHLISIAADSGDSPLSITLPAGIIDIAVQSDAWVVRKGDLVLYQAPITSFASVDLHGSQSDDALHVTVLDALAGKSLHVDGGPGRDSLVLVEAGQTLDLTAPGITLHDIEAIDITGTGDNHLVLDIDKAKAASSTSDTLEVIAGPGDTVQFGTGWNAELSMLIDGLFTQILTAVVDGGTARIELRNDRMFQNPLNRFDADRNGVIQPLDALRVINELRRRGSGPIAFPASDTEISRLYFDVSGDNLFSALDALRVINALSRIHRGSDPEGEAAPPLTTFHPSLHGRSTEPAIEFLGEPVRQLVTPTPPPAISLWPTAVDEIMQREELEAEEGDQSDSLAETLSRRELASGSLVGGPRW